MNMTAVPSGNESRNISASINELGAPEKKIVSRSTGMIE
jgi:hypothetical protein